MKLVSAFAAAVVAVFMFAGGANAAPITAQSLLGEIAGAPSAMTPIACKSIAKRVCVRGRCRTSHTRICTAPKRRPHFCKSSKVRSCTFRKGRRVCTVTTRRVCR